MDGKSPLPLGMVLRFEHHTQPKSPKKANVILSDLVITTGLLISVEVSVDFCFALILCCWFFLGGRV